MQRALILAILAIAAFGGFQATESKALPIECNSTGEYANPVQAGGVVHEGNCGVTEVIDASAKTITVTAGRLPSDFTATNTGRNAWSGYPNAQAAQDAACSIIVPDRSSNSAFAGFTISVIPIDCNGNPSQPVPPAPIVPPSSSDCGTFYNPGTADNAVSQGVTLPAGTCAITEVISSEHEVINITAGRLQAAFTVTKDHNAWAGYPSYAETRAAACEVVSARQADPTFREYIVVSPGCGKVCVDAEIPSGTVVNSITPGSCVMREVVDFEAKRITLVVGAAASSSTEGSNVWAYRNYGTALMAACRNHIPSRTADATFQGFEIRKDFNCPAFSVWAFGVVRN